MSEPVELVDDLDRPIYGLEQSYLVGDKFGRNWRSTKRHLLNSVSAESVGVR